MSVETLGHSPTRWLPDSPRRKPAATNTAAAAVPATMAAMTTSKQPFGGVQEIPLRPIAGPDSNPAAVVIGDSAQAQGSRISFAPGTTFHDRSRLRSRGGSRGASRQVPATFNLRPVTSGDAPHQRRFKLPKATLPTLHYLSVSQSDFMDPRYAEDIVKTYGIPRYFFKSKSNLLLPPASKQQSRKGNDESAEDSKEKDAATLEREAEDARPKTSDNSAVPRLTNRLPIVVPVATTSPDSRSQSGLHTGKEGEGEGEDRLPHVTAVYKPLIGEKYTHARFFPPMNPFRSLQMESEVTKYVEHKKRVGLGKYVRYPESESHPGSALLREASMYDLNRQGPMERPMDGLPPPDRKPIKRQRPRDARGEQGKSLPDRNLAILPRERTDTEKSTVILKDMVKR